MTLLLRDVGKLGVFLVFTTAGRRAGDEEADSEGKCDIQDRLASGK